MLEVNAKKSLRMKGQCFVVFKDVNQASMACAQLNGAAVFGKQMRVTFAKSTSDTIAKLKGTYVHKAKLERDAERKKKREGQ